LTPDGVGGVSGYGDRMRPATTLTMALLLGAIFVAGIISLLQL